MEGNGKEHQGIVPRCIRLLFELINKEKNKRFAVQISYLQVYKEKIYDLLNSSSKKQLQEDGPGL
jgi:kinesin family member 1